MAGQLKEEVVNVALTTSTWQAVRSLKKAKSFSARTRSNEDWRISNDENGATYFTVIGSTGYHPFNPALLKYTFETPASGIVFYAQAVTADILEVLFE